MVPPKAEPHLQDNSVARAREREHEAARQVDAERLLEAVARRRPPAGEAEREAVLDEQGLPGMRAGSGGGDAHAVSIDRPPGPLIPCGSELRANHPPRGTLGVVLHEMRFERSNLEDVFLELTGGTGDPS